MVPPKGCFSKDRCGGKAAKFKESVPRATLDAFFSFAQSVGYKAVFGLSAGVGPRDKNGDWVADDQRRDTSYSAQEGTIARAI